MLQNSLLLRQQAIDHNLSFEVLLNFQQAVIQTKLLTDLRGSRTGPVQPGGLRKRLESRIWEKQKHWWYRKVE